MSSSDSPPGARIEPDALVGSLVADRFRLFRLVSEGANTAIYDAVDEDTGRSVTFKLIRPRLAASPTFRERFDRSMRSAAALSHPNIAAVYDWGLAPVGDTTTAYVVIEELAGGSLRDLFDRGRRLSPSQALAVGLDACRGLDYAHRRGLVHTELTPSKLVFGDDRRLRIVDFGLARLLGEPGWAQPESVANHVAWYSAPEQGAGGEIDGRTDVYALCLTLHEAVTGELPFRHDSTVASLGARVGRLMPVSADLGPLAAVFERAGRPDRDERATAAEFGKGLVQAASKLPRPEPIPLLSTGLFDTPVDRLRSPEDPTGGVHRPGEGGTGEVHVVPLDEPTPEPDPIPSPSDADLVPEPPHIVEAEPDADIPAPEPGDDLVILPIDSGIAADVRQPEEAPVSSPPTTPHPAGERVTPSTQVMATVPPAGSAEAPRRRRRFPWRILLGLLVIAALAVLGVLATRLFETPTYVVPDLTEMPEPEARNLIASNGWVISVTQERSDEVPTEGLVVRTRPQAGVELAEGEPFLIVVSAGPELRPLPDSTGLPLGVAQTRLLEADLVVQEVVEEFDELVPDGTVVSWSVPTDPTLVAGSQVEPGTPVVLVVSKGPEPRVVPDLVGRAIGGVRDELSGLGLQVDVASREFSDDAPLGTVMSQDTAPGTEVERGSTVSVVVSRGPDLVSFPDLSDAANFDEAAELLRAAGFEAELVFGDAQGEIQSIDVDGAEPDVGETFRRGTLVRIRAFDTQ